MDEPDIWDAPTKRRDLLSDGARVISVIETMLTRRGSGKDDSSPIRIVRQYWSLDGRLLAETDPAPKELSK